MSRLPNPGGDNGNWGVILNDYLSQTLNPNGTLKDNSVGPAQIADNAVNAASIADGSITESILDSSVQTKLNQAASKFTEFYDNFSDSADFTTSSSGHEYTDAQNAVSSGLSKVNNAGSKIVVSSDVTSTGISAGYKQWDFGGEPMTFGQADLQFADTGSTAGGAFCFATASGYLTLQSGNLGVDVSVHFVVTSNYFSIGEFTSGVFREIAAIPFDSVGFNRFHIEFGMDYVEGSMYVRDPWGVVSKVTDAALKRKFRYSFYEIYYNHANTDDRIAIHSVSASNTPIQSPSASTTLLKALRNDYQSQTLVSTSWRIAKTYGADEFVSSGSVAFAGVVIPGITSSNFKAPPSGTIIVKIGCFIEVFTPTYVFFSANIAGTSSQVVNTIVRSPTEPAEKRRYEATVVITGLTPGGVYSVTPTFAASIANSAAIESNANQQSILVVEPA